MDGTVEIINVMADGSICEDLTDYFLTHPMPLEVQEIIRNMVFSAEKRK